MRITDAFLDEHVVLLTQLDELARLAGIEQHGQRSAGSAGWHGPEEFAARLLLHARLEDELLFGYLEPQLGHSGPIEVMRSEHVEIEALLADLCAAPDSRTARAPATALVRLAREHFAKEEQVLFPMAEQLLGQDVLAELGERYAAAAAPGPR